MAVTLDIVSAILREYQNIHGLAPQKHGKLPTSHAEIPVRTSKLKPLIEVRGYADRIHLFEAEYDGMHIVAQIQVMGVLGQPYNTSGVANIYLAQNLNLCWQRFATCKEMFHCMIDRLDAQRVTSLKQLKELLSLLAEDTTALTGEAAAFTSERVAELYALETLFPVEFRMVHLDDFLSGSLTASDIAGMYRIPEVYVHLAFEKRYLDTVTRLRGKLISI
ncbi:hypothetical protein [Sulfitobacter dubius]|uniref:hypothetical protein n=1 Tax=Sulfitobacter dubius TaxID=218673 RepID=UPI002942FFDA|nr:hypothetical protein [Sulfitobacter dubius]WOI28723.1 hypothetical protein R1T39_13690 [Sulfitobacter dubius]